MKTLLAATLFAAATQVHALGLEADLDGNASALQASEPRPQPQAKLNKGKRQRVVAAVAMGRQSR
jgi:hypothetical protein